MSDPEIERLLAEARRGMPPPAEPAAEAAPALDPSLAPTGGPGPLTSAPPGSGSDEPGREGLLARALQLRLAAILTSRYVDLKLGDLTGTLILVAQAPLIGFLVSLAFDGQREGESLQFVLAMVAVWLGTFNSCREVVKERLIFLRERRTGVPVRAYLVSKVLVLSCLAALQALLLVAAVQRTVRFESNLALVFAALFAIALTSTALGLLLSSTVKSQNSLIALVPIALIPQLIFSDALLHNPGPAVERIELIMIADWGLELLRELREDDVSWVEVAKCSGVLTGMGLGLLLLAGVCLRAQEE